VDRVPTTLFFNRAGSLGVVPQAVSGDAGRSPQRRPPAVLRRSCAARRQGCIRGQSGATAQDQLGGLRQGAVRRAQAGVALSVALHHRIAISNRRLLSADENGVTFKYKDYRIEGPARYKTMMLATDEFIRRFLIHVLPKGFHRIRHYGLLANGNRPRNIAHARQLLALPARPKQPETLEAALEQPRALPRPCPYCGSRMIIIETFARGCEPKYRPTPPAAIRIDTS
jgi:Putative transposase